jgi:hypothetical protein
MSEQGVVAVLVTLIASLSQVALAWLRYYYRAHYGLRDGENGSANGTKPPGVP